MVFCVGETKPGHQPPGPLGPNHDVGRDVGEKQFGAPEERERAVCIGGAEAAATLGVDLGAENVALRVGATTSGMHR